MLKARSTQLFLSQLVDDAFGLTIMSLCWLISRITVSSVSFQGVEAWYCVPKYWFWVLLSKSESWEFFLSAYLLLWQAEKIYTPNLQMEAEMLWNLKCFKYDGLECLIAAFRQSQALKANPKKQTTTKPYRFRWQNTTNK